MPTPEEILRARQVADAQAAWAEQQAAPEHDLDQVRREAVRGCAAAIAVLAAHQFPGAQLVHVQINHGGFLRDRIERFEKAAWRVWTEPGAWQRDSHEQVDVWIDSDLKTYRRSGQWWTVGELADEPANRCQQARAVLRDLADEFTIRDENREADRRIAQDFGIPPARVTQTLNDAMQPAADRSNARCRLTVDEAHLPLVRLRLEEAREWLATGRSPDDLAGLPTRETPPAQWNFNAGALPRFDGVYEFDRSLPRFASFSHLRFYQTGFVSGTTIGETDPVRPPAVRAAGAFRYLRVDNDRVPSGTFQVEGVYVSFDLGSRYSNTTAVRGSLAKDGLFLEADSSNPDFRGLWTFRSVD